MICQFLACSQGLLFHFSLEGLQLRRILNPVFASPVERSSGLQSPDVQG